MQVELEPLDPGAVASLVMAAFALLSVPVRMVVPGVMVSSACKSIARGTWKSSSTVQQPNMLPDTDEGKLLGVFLSKTIVGAAIL